MPEKVYTDRSGLDWYVQFIGGKYYLIAGKHIDIFNTYEDLQCCLELSIKILESF